MQASQQASQTQFAAAASADRQRQELQQQTLCLLNSPRTLLHSLKALPHAVTPGQLPAALPHIETLSRLLGLRQSHRQTYWSLACFPLRFWVSQLMLTMHHLCNSQPLVSPLFHNSCMSSCQGLSPHPTVCRRLWQPSLTRWGPPLPSLGVSPASKLPRTRYPPSLTQVLFLPSQIPSCSCQISSFPSMEWVS